MILPGKRRGLSVEKRKPRAGLCGAGNGVGALVHVGGHDICTKKGLGLWEACC